MFLSAVLPFLSRPEVVSRTVSAPWHRILLFCTVIGIVAGERVAWADRDETSFHAQLQLGQATFGDPVRDDLSDAAGFLGVGARGTYATNNWYAYEAHLTWGQLTRSAEFALSDGGTMFRKLGWLRVDTGITARLGVEYVPTLHAALGVQSRFGGEAISAYPSWTGVDDDAYMTLDLMGTVGAGFDWRPPGDGDHWVFGGLVMLQRALLSTGPRYEAMSVMLHVAYYYY